MNSLLFFALAALFTALVVVAPHGPRWLSAVSAYDVETTNGACIDPDGNKIVPPPSGCPSISFP